VLNNTVEGCITNTVLKKLNYKGQDPILIIDPPDQFQPVINGLTAEIHTQIRRKYDFILFFVRSLADAYNQVEAIVNALEEDGHLWLCYPKGTSKKYEANINRTRAWDVLSPYDFEAVSQIAIDDDWSALRFKHVDTIKTMRRKTAATPRGKDRIKK